MQLAGFPQMKKLEEFDPALTGLIRELASLNFLQEAKNILFVGAAGIGKTHLAISIGIKAILPAEGFCFLLRKSYSSTCFYLIKLCWSIFHIF